MKVKNLVSTPLEKNGKNFRDQHHTHTFKVSSCLYSHLPVFFNNPPGGESDSMNLHYRCAVLSWNLSHAHTCTCNEMTFVPDYHQSFVYHTRTSKPPGVHQSIREWLKDSVRVQWNVGQLLKESEGELCTDVAWCSGTLPSARSKVESSVWSTLPLCKKEWDMKIYRCVCFFLHKEMLCGQTGNRHRCASGAGRGEEGDWEQRNDSLCVSFSNVLTFWMTRKTTSQRKWICLGMPCGAELEQRQVAGGEAGWMHREGLRPSTPLPFSDAKSVHSVIPSAHAPRVSLPIRRARRCFRCCQWCLKVQAFRRASLKEQADNKQVRMEGEKVPVAGVQGSGWKNSVLTSEGGGHCWSLFLCLREQYSCTQDNKVG